MPGQPRRSGGYWAHTGRDNRGAKPFTVYARNGWPLMAGWVAEAAFLTQTVRFDLYPDDAIFQRP